MQMKIRPSTTFVQPALAVAVEVVNRWWIRIPVIESLHLPSDIIVYHLVVFSNDLLIANPSGAESARRLAENRSSDEVVQKMGGETGQPLTSGVDLHLQVYPGASIHKYG
jgi:hypothetical protein